MQREGESPSIIRARRAQARRRKRWPGCRVMSMGTADQVPEMVERVARAIQAADVDWGSGRGTRSLSYYAGVGVDTFGHDSGKVFPALFESAARAAIAALREPTEAMQKASRIVTDVAPDTARITTWGANVWPAMIDAALSGSLSGGGEPQAKSETNPTPYGV